MKKQIFNEPLIFGEHADPSILLDEDSYYMVFSSCFGNYGLMQMWTSDNLIDWRPLYYVTTCGKVEAAWAPELVRYKNDYYIYNYAPGSGCFVLKSKNIRKGEWNGPYFLPEVEGIDPGHVVDEQGKRYLVLSGNRLYPLSEDGIRIIGKAKNICEDWPIPDSMDMEGVYNEGPKFFVKNGYYYYTVAEGGTEGPPTSHGIISYRSRNLCGPYELSPYTPVIHTESRLEKWWSKGHGTIFQNREGNWYVVYHAIENGHRFAGRITLLAPVVWDDNEWFYVAGDSCGVIADTAEENKENLLTMLNYNAGDSMFSVLYNHCSSELFHRTAYLDMGIKIRPVTANLSLDDMITFTPQSHTYSFVLTVTLESGAAVGLGYWFDSNMNCGIYASKVIGLYKHGHIIFEKEEIPLETEEITLKMKLNHGTVSYWYQKPGETWRKNVHAFDVADWNPNVCSGFGYARPGFLIFGEGAVIIRKLEYQED